MIFVRNTEYTDLDPVALRKTAAKYARGLRLKKNIDIVFDKRLTGENAGMHDFDRTKQTHIIKISPCPDAVVEKSVIKYGVISSILHELKHCQQREKDKHQYNSKEFSEAPILNQKMAEWYSQCETEARVYENKHLHNAVAFYNSLC